MNNIKDHIRTVLKTCREVTAAREDFEPGTAEWYTLLALAQETHRLIISLPAELLPEEERPSPAMAEILDALRDSA
ncbi:hypothetical protein Q3V23_23400 [Streptomyces sp. VNUA116]|uniref:hypothetical protein n=1 Tax=Streptomyces sp. VNUA116 TaxID=3062449 RepID=UPI002676CE08|nr:hypothetical protein [Streptomyces sp. VNUA116]WKU46768.1 hypothetical protein Q3V23_23400 [Streptomyces sp. VNUA116]